MYNVTQTFLDKIKSYSRSFDSSITIRDVTFTEDDIISISLSEDVNPADSFMIGSVASNVLEIEIMNVPESLILDGAKVTARIGVNTGSAFEYVPLGVFWVDEIKKDGYSIKLTCVDNMIKLEKAYFSNLSYPASINSVVQEICTKVGIELATTLPSTQINKIEGYTYREAISFIASFLGSFARFNRLGKLEIVSYATTNISIENQFSFTTNEKPFTIGRISCQVGENILTAGSSGNEIQLENPIMTQTQLNNIYNTLKTLNYMPYDMEYEGNPALMAGDKITIVGPDDVVYNTLLMRHKISYTGGLNATGSAVGKTEQGQEFNSGGSLKNSVSRMVIEQANIKILLAEKATIEDLTATNAKVENLYATKATIQDLTAANARIDNLVVTKATIVDLTAAVARIGILEVGSATVTQLNAANAKIATLETRAASIDTLLSGNLTADNMKANLITAGTTLIADGSIASAKIISLSVDKILAGDISTNKFRIVSSSGNMLISDNTIQIKDSTRVRVQIGKDASNDYNMYVWDSSGNLMFDAAGLKASGIKAKIIRDDMVSDTANINASKIEKESLVTRINGATTLLLASKVKLDTENQTLEVAFNSLKSTVTTTASTVTSQGTSISTIQGQIQAKIWQQDITSAANSLDTRISSTETSITALNNAISLKVSASDFTTYQSTVTNSLNSKANQSALNTTNGNVSSLTTRVSTAESSISVLQNQISLKVEQSDIITAINNISIGARNIVKNSTFNFGKSYWNTMGGYWTILPPETDKPDSSIAQAQYTGYAQNSPLYNYAPGTLVKADNTEKVTVSFDIYADDINLISSTILTLRLFPTSTSLDYVTLVASFNRGQITGYTNGTWARYSYTYSIPSSTAKYLKVGLYQSAGNVNFKIREIKVELGTKATDWTAAPEDQTAYTDTQINTAKAEIKVTTDSISSTVSSVQSSVTSLGTRVTSAESSIISLNNSITLKVNTSDFTSYKTTNDSAVNSKASQTALNTTNGNVTALTTRVSTAESSISVLQGQIVSKVTQTDINSSINNLSIGGRNLLRGTLKWEGWSKSDSSNQIVISDNIATFTTNKNTTSFIQQLNIPVVAGEQYTLSVKIKITTSIVGLGLNLYWGRMSNGSWINKSIPDKSNSDYTTYLFTFVPDETNIKVCIQCNNCTDGVALVKEMKLEKGSKATDWTPAPEDVQGQIDSTTTRISTAESTITQLSSSIDLKVETSAYNTKMTSLDSSISSLTSRVSSAELKITDSSIVSTVRTSTAYTNDLAAKANQSALNTTNGNVNALTTRVTNSESSITQLNNQIALKVNQGDFGTLITQNVSSVRIAVGQIGGTNLIRNSRGDLGSYSWSGVVDGYYNDITVRDCGSGVIRLLNGTTTEQFAYNGVMYNNPIILKANTKYTLSGKYWVGANSKGIDIYVLGTKAPQTTGYTYVHYALADRSVTTGNFKSFSYTFTTNSDEYSCSVRVDNEGTTNGSVADVYFMLKLEEGDNATAWSPHPSELKNTTVDISDAGLKVRNGAISILNNAGVEVLKGDTNGNLSIRGDFTNYDTTTGNMAIRITNRTIDFNDWDSNSICGTIFAGKLVGQTSTRGMSFGAKRNKYLDIAYEDSNGNFAAAIRLDNGALGTTGKAHVYDGGSANFTSLYVSGSKNCIQDTENYGKRLLYAYETTESYLGDFVHGKINENGECVISIDEIFGECVNTDIQYHVFTQTYKGSITEIELYPNYFIVKGEAGTFFSCEIKVKRKGFEHVRLEQKFVEQQGAENIEDELKQILSSDIEEELYGDLANELLEV